MDRVFGSPRPTSSPILPLRGRATLIHSQRQRVSAVPAVGGELCRIFGRARNGRQVRKRSAPAVDLIDIVQIAGLSSTRPAELERGFGSTLDSTFSDSPRSNDGVLCPEPPTTFARPIKPRQPGLSPIALLPSSFSARLALASRHVERQGCRSRGHEKLIRVGLVADREEALLRTREYIIVI